MQVFCASTFCLVVVLSSQRVLSPQIVGGIAKLFAISPTVVLVWSASVVFMRSGLQTLFWFKIGVCRFLCHLATNGLNNASVCLALPCIVVQELVLLVALAIIVHV